MRNECHIWAKLEKKTKKLKIKAWEFFNELDDGSQRNNAAKIPVVKDHYAKFAASWVEPEVEPVQSGHAEPVILTVQSVKEQMHGK